MVWGKEGKSEMAGVLGRVECFGVGIYRGILVFKCVESETVGRSSRVESSFMECVDHVGRRNQENCIQLGCGRQKVSTTD